MELNNDMFESQGCLYAFGKATEAVRLINEQLREPDDKLMALVSSSFVGFGKACADCLHAGVGVLCEPSSLTRLP